MNVEDFAKRIREDKLLLPPLADYTDYPYRRVMVRFKPPFIVTEMISALAVVHGGEKTRRMLAKIDLEYEGVQLVGANPDIMADSARIVAELGYAYVDINMGCTIKKVARQGAGISLMGEEKKAQRVASAVVESVDIPVMCKMRLGVSNSKLNAVTLSRQLEEVGVAAVTIHGRSGEKKWGIPVNFTGIREVVEALSIPVVANGGIFTGADAKVMMEKTGAAGVMPGRGLIGNPWIVPEIIAALSGGDYTSPTISERKMTCLLHLNYMREHYGDMSAAVRMRRILPKYFSGCKNLRVLRQDVNGATTPDQVAQLLDRIEDNGSHGIYDDFSPQ
jgi:tRNA-dihydrouridine synthase B